MISGMFEQELLAYAIFGIILNFLFSMLFGLYLSKNIGIEEMMMSQDFIPELIPAISRCYAGESMTPLEDCFTAYEFMMNRALEGINYAVEVASGGQIHLGLEDTIYNTGNIFEI